MKIKYLILVLSVVIVIGIVQSIDFQENLSLENESEKSVEGSQSENLSFENESLQESIEDVLEVYSLHENSSLDGNQSEILKEFEDNDFFNDSENSTKLDVEEDVVGDSILDKSKDNFLTNIDNELGSVAETFSGVQQNSLNYESELFEEYEFVILKEESFFVFPVLPQQNFNEFFGKANRGAIVYVYDEELGWIYNFYESGTKKWIIDFEIGDYPEDQEYWAVGFNETRTFKYVVDGGAE